VALLLSKQGIDYLYTDKQGVKMLSASFTNWVLSFNPMERVLVAATTTVKRSESLEEFFAARSNPNVSR
jgi:hypothetical protein